MFQGNVTFDDKGNHLRHAWYWSRAEHNSRPNFIFKDQLKLVKVRSNQVDWKSVNTGKTYSSFISDLNKFVPLMVNGVVEGMFTFRANGSYTSLIPTVFEYEDYTSPKVISGEMKLGKINPQALNQILT